MKTVKRNKIPDKQVLRHLTLNEVVETFKVSRKTALRWLQKCGLREKRNRLNQELANEIRELSANCTARELANLFNVSLTAIYRVLNNLSYPVPKGVCGGEAKVSTSYNVPISFPRFTFIVDQN